MKSRSAIKTDPLAHEHHRKRIDALGDPLAEIESSGLQPPFEHPGRADAIRETLSADDRFDVVEPDDPAGRFLALACLRYGNGDSPERWRTAADLLRSDPAIATASIWTMAASFSAASRSRFCSLIESSRCSLTSRFCSLC